MRINTYDIKVGIDSLDVESKGNITLTHKLWNGLFIKTYNYQTFIL